MGCRRMGSSLPGFSGPLHAGLADCTSVPFSFPTHRSMPPGPPLACWRKNSSSSLPGARPSAGAVPGAQAFELLRWAVPVGGPFAGHDVAGATGRTVGEVERKAHRGPRRIRVVAAAVHRVGKGFGLSPACSRLRKIAMVVGGVLHHPSRSRFTAQAASGRGSCRGHTVPELAVVGVHRVGQVLHEQAVAGSAGQAHRAALQSPLRPLVLEAGRVLVLAQQFAPGFLRLRGTRRCSCISARWKVRPDRCAGGPCARPSRYRSAAFSYWWLRRQASAHDHCRSILPGCRSNAPA